MPLVKNKTGEFGWYSHIPKCAGSSIIDSFVYHNWMIHFNTTKQIGDRQDFAPAAKLYLRDYNGLSESSNPKEFPSTNYPCSHQHWHLEIVKYYCDLSHCKYKFAIVRDPVERLISEFRFRKGAYCPMNSTRTWEDYDLGIHGNSEVKTTNFSYWLRRSYETSILNPYIWDNHFRPQCEFVEPGFAIIPFNLDKINFYLQDRLGFESKIPWVNKSEFEEVNATQEDRQFIEEWYNRDYELFANKKDYNWIE